MPTGGGERDEPAGGHDPGADPRATDGARRPAWLRRAGRLEVAAGGDILWSVAEGSRGRRWRSLRRDKTGRLVSDLLLELGPGGDWTRLELATSYEILTLHPAGDEVHGNVISPVGVGHLALPWGPARWLLIEGEPVAAVALGTGQGSAAVAGLRIGPDLAVHAIAGPPPDPAGLTTGRPRADGLPGPSWPLEV